MKNDTEQTLDWVTLCLVLGCFLAAMTMTGCATDPAVMQMALDAQNNTKPTLKVTCPTGGCAIEYTDPRDRQAVKLPTNGWDFANKVTDTIGAIATTAVVPAAFAITATKGFDALKGSGSVQTTTTNTTTTSTANTTTTSTTASLTGSGVIGSGTNTAPTTTTTTTTTDNHSQTATPTVVNGRICSIDAGGVLVCQP